MISVKLGGRQADLPLPPTYDELETAIRTALGIAPDAKLKLLCKGKALDPSAPLSLAANSKLMVMQTSAASIREVEEAKPERMRGFAEGDAVQRTGGLGGRPAARAAASSAAASPYRFHAIRELAVPAVATPPAGRARALLRRLADDRSLQKVMASHEFSVGLLAEMPPEGMVGVSQSCLMGFNRNRGMEIHLRLRTDDWAGLRPYASIVDVLCHELAHNVHDDHDDNFKALKSTLSREYSLHLARERAAPSVGGAAARAPDEEAEAAAGDGTHVLGGGGGAPGDARSAGAAAAERRAAAAEEGCVPCEDEGG